MLRTALLLLTAVVATPIAGQQLEIHHIDVDQGDATLVVTPNGNPLLIDSGLDSRGDEVASGGVALARISTKVGLGAEAFTRCGCGCRWRLEGHCQPQTRLPAGRR